MSIKMILGKALLGAKTHAPGGLMVLGTGLEIAAIFYAAKEGPKAALAIDETKKEIAKCKDVRDKGEITYLKDSNEEGGDPVAVTEEYNEKDYAKDLTICYIRGIKRVARSMALPIGLGGSGLICFWLAHHITKNRLIAATALLTKKTRDFAQYRNRVIADAGEEKDREYLYGLKKVDSKRIDENGEVVTDNRYILDESVDHNSPLFNAYTVKIDLRNYAYKLNYKSPIHLKHWLQICLDNANRIYHTKGWIGADEVFHVFDISEDNCDEVDMNAAKIIGKILPNEGEDYITCGCFGPDGELNLTRNVDDDSIYLTFNFDVDPIIGRIPTKNKKQDITELVRKYPDIEK